MGILNMFKTGAKDLGSSLLRPGRTLPSNVFRAPVMETLAAAHPDGLVPTIFQKVGFSSTKPGHLIHNAVDRMFFTSSAAKAAMESARGGEFIASELPDVNRRLDIMFNKQANTIRKQNPTFMKSMGRAMTPRLGLADLTVSGVGIGLGGYAMASGINSDKNSYLQTRSMMRQSLNYGGSNRAQDFIHNPMVTGSRPRVRGGSMGASGGLVLAMNNLRTVR